LIGRKTTVYVGGKTREYGAQAMANFSEVVKMYTYTRILGIAMADGRERLCGVRTTKLTLCDTTVEHAADINKLVSVYEEAKNEIVMGMRLLTLRIDATMPTQVGDHDFCWQFEYLGPEAVGNFNIREGKMLKIKVKS